MQGQREKSRAKNDVALFFKGHCHSMFLLSGSPSSRPIKFTV